MINPFHYLYAFWYDTILAIILISILVIGLGLSWQLSQISISKLKYQRHASLRSIAIWCSLIMRHLGIPFGLITAAVGSIRVFFHMAKTNSSTGFDASVSLDEVITNIEVVTQILLLGILYGGFFAAFGYYLSSKYQHLIEHEKDKLASTLSVSIIVLLLIMYPFFGIAVEYKYLDEIFTLPSLFGFGCILLSISFAFLFSNSSNRFRMLANASLLGALCSMIIGIILQFQIGFTGLSIAFSGMAFGLLSYICIYIFAYHSGGADKINADLISRHWLEIFVFILFLFLAPATIRDKAIFEAQEAELDNFKERLEQLENSPTETKTLPVIKETPE